MAIVGVPLVALIALSTSAAWSLRDRADDAAAVEQIAARLGRAVDAETAMRRENQTRQFVLYLQVAGLTPEVAPALGVDPTQLGPTATATDAALAALGPDAASIDQVELRTIRETTASNPAHAEELLARTETVLGQFRALTADLLDDLRDTGDAVTGSSRLANALQTVQLMRDVADADNAAISAGQRYLVVPGNAARSWQGLVGAAANITLTTERVDALIGPEHEAAWRELNDRPDSRMVHEAYAILLEQAAADDNAPSSPRTLATDLPRRAFAYQDGVYGLLAAATGAVRDAAQTIGDDARAEFQRWVGLAVGVAAVSVGLSLWIARSILNPLRRLATSADAIGKGELAFEPGLPRVPRELAVTFRAMGELAANLQVLEAKTQALAAGDLDSPALTVPLPGALGRSLERSAEVLSGSLSERDRLRSNLIHQASHDPLTGLHNRLAATDALQDALESSGPGDRGVAVSVIDLDDFKRANDTYGHDFGDRVLKVQAQRITEIAGDAFTARLGADEFGLIHERVEDVRAVADLAHHLTKVLAEPIHLDGTTVTLTASVGIVLAEDATLGADQVLARADLAMHRAKRMPGSAVELYDEGLQEQLRRHVAIEQALKASLDTDTGLFLVYQPVLDAATMRPSGVEALVRWDRPGHGIQPPDSFIPVAESSDLIVEVDRWVFEHALAQLATWGEHPELRHLNLAVNASGRHLMSRTLADHIADALARTGADPSRLVVEVTETLLLDNIELAARELAAVRELGVKVAIDDFGTGYTSLAHLQELPADIIKIDRSFIQRLDRGRDRTLTALTTDVAHQLGATTVAEGIETPEQLAIVRSLGCDEAQGYLFARPLPPQELAMWVQGASAPAALANTPNSN